MLADHSLLDVAPQEKLDGVDSRLESHLVTGGPFDSAYRHILAAPGKRVRAAMVLACTRLLPEPGRCGVNEHDALDMACAIEMLHEASLVHDDICDGSLLRRGAASVPAAYGVRTAANAGFHLAGIALHVLAGVIERNPTVFHGLGEACSKITYLDKIAELSFGQLVESNPTQLDDASLRRHYRTVATAKTGTLFRLACSYGGTCGGCDVEQLTALMTYADHLSIGFQIMDDVRDVEGGPNLGKDAGTDLNRNLPTWPVIEWLGVRRISAASWLAAGAGQRSPDEIATICADLVTSGATKLARDVAADEIAIARRSLVGFAATPGREHLLDLCDRVMRR